MKRCAADVTAIILCTVADECTCMDCSSFMESYPVSNLMYVDYTNNYIRGMRLCRNVLSDQLIRCPSLRRDHNVE